MINEKRAWAEIDLDALVDNFNAIRAHVGEKTKIMAVVKADGYGHGYLEVAKTLIDSGADALAVAFIDEAIPLRWLRRCRGPGRSSTKPEKYISRSTRA